MKRIRIQGALCFFSALCLLGSCNSRNFNDEDNYIEVIGEAEQVLPEAGYRLNLSYNGPLDTRNRFLVWADSLKQQFPSMSKINEGIYINYMPEQMGKRISKDMYQTSVSYNLVVDDSATYNRITEDLLRHNIPFNVNVSGTIVESSKKVNIQKELMQQALHNAKTKLDLLTTEGQKYEIVGIEELSQTPPYGPEYYDYNRIMVTRIKVKAKQL